MKPQVTAATASLLPLLLLSAITAVESQPLDGFTVFPNSYRKSSMENCAEYKNISKWFDLQSAAIESVKKHNVYLEEALGTKASKNCCFYDKDLMQLVIENINQIDQQNGNSPKMSLKPSGDLNEDLNKIIPGMKKLVSNAFKSCCSKMEESLKNLKNDLQKQLSDYKEQFKSNTSDEFSKDKGDLEGKHNSLEDKIKDIKKRLDELKNKEDTTGSGSQSSCCAELNTKIEALEKQLNAAKSENAEKSNQFENQLKDIENMLESLKNRVKDSTNTLDTQGEAFESELEKCKRKFGKSSKDLDNTNICIHKHLDRIKELKDRLVLLIDKLTKLGSQDNSACLENDKRMEKIRGLIDETEKNPGNVNSANARTGTYKTICLSNEELNHKVKLLEGEEQELLQSTNKSQRFCESIEKLKGFSEYLAKIIDENKKIYAEYRKLNELELKGLKKQINETLTKLDGIKISNNTNNNEEDFKKLKDLQAMLENVKNELKVLESEVNELSNLKDNDNLSADLEKMEKESDQFWLEVDRRLSYLEGQNSKELPDNTTDPGNALEKQYNDLSQAQDKVKQDLESLRNLDKLYKLELEKLKMLEKQVDKCLNACKEVPKMHALLKKVTDMMNILKSKKSKRTPVPSRPKTNSQVQIIKKKIKKKRN